MSHGGRKFWKWFRGRPAIIFLSVLLVLILVRLAMPFALRSYVNKKIDQVQGFGGNVGGIQINLFRGAYKIINLRLIKMNADVPKPFLWIPEMDLSVEWRALFQGALVGKIVVQRPQINFVNGPTERQQQTGITTGWQKTLNSLFPLTINRFQVNDGTIRFADPYRDPPVDVSVTNLWATATNLTNVREKNTRLPAGLLAHGVTTGHGQMEIRLRLDPLADSPTFKLQTSITNLNLVALNDFMRSYGNFDVQSGRFALFVNVAAADEKFHGDFKPFFFDAKILTWRELEQQNIFKDFWEAIVQGVSEIFRNQAENQLATTVPIDGSFQRGGSVDLWAAVGGILRNAFVHALLPKMNPPVVGLPGGQTNSPLTENAP